MSVDRNVLLRHVQFPEGKEFFPANECRVTLSVLQCIMLRGGELRAVCEDSTDGHKFVASLVATKATLSKHLATANKRSRVRALFAVGSTRLPHLDSLIPALHTLFHRMRLTCVSRCISDISQTMGSLTPVCVHWRL